MAHSSSTLSTAEPPLPLEAPGQRAPRRPVNWRSLLLGLLGVLFVCSIAPYNDFVVSNTYFIGNALPIGVVMFLLTVVILINAPLHRYWPGVALESGELAVALGMMLVSCALPSSGLMRYLPAHLVSYYYHVQGNVDYRDLLLNLRLPDWMFPSFPPDRATTAAGRLLDRASSPVIQWFWNRSPLESDTLKAHLLAVPWGAWLAPALSWGIFFSGLFGAVLCLTILVRRQWVDNERLAFPLASIYLSLIEAPRPGKSLNQLFRSAAFWSAFGAVFILYFINGMSEYDPRHWPKIQTHYDLNNIFGDEPFRYLEWGLKSATLFFSIVGITFFIQTRMAFSLWFFFILFNLAKIGYGEAQGDFTQGMQADQFFGAIFPMAISILWVGRGHWMLILNQMFRGARHDEPAGRYVPYALAGWALVACTVLAIGWLVVAGMTLVGAIVLILMILLLYMLMARVVAETGLIFCQFPNATTRPWVYALDVVPASWSMRAPFLKNIFFTNAISNFTVHDMRETLPVFASHAVRIADSAAYDRVKNWRQAWPFVASLVLALVVGYFVSGAAMLYCEYNYGATLDKRQESPINSYGIRDSVLTNVLNPTLDFKPPAHGPKETHNRLGHFAFGAVLVSVLSFLRLRYEAWPVHPIGFLLVYTYPTQTIWFSIFIGWLAKLLIVRFGGVDLYRKARPFFIGLILGEAGSVAFWLVVSLVRVQMHLDYNAIHLLPR